MQDRDTYLREVAEWQATYAQLSERQRNRKMEIKDSQRSIEELPVFSYVWPQERQDEWNRKYGRSYGSYTSRHSALQLTVNDAALQAQAMLRARSAMKAQAGRDTSLVPTVAVAS
jgi:hypothetical protein